MSSFYFRPFKTLTSLLYYFSFLRWITLSIVRMFDYDRLFTRCTRCPPGSTCLCVHERWWRQCDWIWRTMFFDEDIKSVYYYYHVECLFCSFFPCPREIHDKIFACSCVCLPFWISAAVREVNWKKKLTGCVRKEWKVCVWNQLSARLSGNFCDSLQVQKLWHYCICLLSCLFFSHIFVPVFVLFTVKCNKIIFCF